MSAEATAYVTALRECPDGAELTCTQKCVLYCLADHHNRSTRRCDPSQRLMAEESLVSYDTVQRAVAYLDAHGVIERRKPTNQGRGKHCSYVFLALDAPDRLRAKLSQLEKGVHSAPLFSQLERAAEGPQPAPERAAEGPQRPQRNKEEPITEVQNLEPSTARAALKVWFQVKLKLQQQLPADEVKLWVKPARLQRVMAGQHMLIALPPSNPIMQAAHARRQLLRGLLAPHHYSASFVKYADEYDKAECRERFGIEVQTYGTRRQISESDSRPADRPALE